jgi:hypothetical protein
MHFITFIEDIFQSFYIITVLYDDNNITLVFKILCYHVY